MNKELQHQARLSRRQFLALIGTMSTGCAVSACGRNWLSGQRTASETDEPDRAHVQLVYQDWRSDWFPSMAQEMLEKFHAEHPLIRVFYTPDPLNMEVDTLADLQAGTAADVFQGCCTFFPTWAQLGLTLDLQPFVDRDLDQATIDDWDQAQYEALALRDGPRFGLPKYRGALALYYNKDLFDKYQVAYPTDQWTYDDYLAAMQKLTHDQDSDGATDLWGSMTDIAWERLQLHVNNWGGHLVAPENPARCLMGAPEAMAAFEWLRARMWDDGVMASFLNVQNMSTRSAFINQRVAMVEDGSWALKDILVGSNFRIGVAPLPRGPVRRTTLATTDGFGIYVGTTHSEEAWTLMKFLISKRYGRAMAKANFLQPARDSLVDEWVDFIRAEFPKQTNNMDIAVFAHGHREDYSVTVEIAANMAEAQRIADDAWDKVFTLGQAPVSLIKQGCQQINGQDAGDGFSLAN